MGWVRVLHLVEIANENVIARNTSAGFVTCRVDSRNKAFGLSFVDSFEQNNLHSRDDLPN
jgi:hypothetical protein